MLGGKPDRHESNFPNATLRVSDVVPPMVNADAGGYSRKKLAICMSGCESEEAEQVQAGMPQCGIERCIGQLFAVAQH